MRNNVVGKISMASSKKKRARFNLSHDVNTTAGWTETQPLMCRLMIPDSKMTVQAESLVRLAPMVAPTFGRVRAKQWHQFVPVSDLSKNFVSMLAQEPVTRGVDTFKPESVPSISLGVLSFLVLIGSRMTAYRCAAGEYFRDDDLVLGRNQTPAGFLDYFRSRYSDGSNDDIKACFGGYSGPIFNFGCLLPKALAAVAPNLLWLPLGRGVTHSMKDLLDSGTTVNGAWVSNNDYVSLDSADYVLCSRDGDSVNDSGYRWVLAFKLSNFGKRLRKILLGCGYQINFDSVRRVSLLPLFAYYKAYFDIFGLTLYNAWETTNCASVLTYCDFNNFTNFDACFGFNSLITPQVFTGVGRKWWSFVNDLGSCWTTDAVDYVAAHIGSTAVSPGAQKLTDSFVDVNGLGASINANMNSGEIPEANSNRNGHAFINSVLHGQLDSETLKRLYKWTNRNTIAGRRLYELLKAQGLGKFADECKSNFIGFKEVEISISDVVSTSDTFKDGSGDSSASGAVLGEYGGRGLQYDKTKTFVFEANEYGYWITLFAIVPEAGFCQAIDKSVEALEKFDFYNPEFDGLGYEASSKANVVASSDVSNEVVPGVDAAQRVGSVDSTFGFVPRYSGLKIANNVMNGDFNLRSVRDTYLPYSLDRFIELNHLEAEEQSNGTGVDQLALKISVRNFPSVIPVAGNTWRFIARYPWIGNFNRIFANMGKEYTLYRYGDADDDDVGQVADYEIADSSYDNFLIHNVLNVQSYAPMLPIADSFETDDDGRTDMSIEKA